MNGDYLPLLIFLIFVAAMLRDDFAFTLIYLLVGVFLVGNWWSRRALVSVNFSRKFNDHAFLGETVKIELELKNDKVLPVPWLKTLPHVPPPFDERIIRILMLETMTFLPLLVLAAAIRRWRASARVSVDRHC